MAESLDDSVNSAVSLYLGPRRDNVKGVLAWYRVVLTRDQHVGLNSYIS